MMRRIIHIGIISLALIFFCTGCAVQQVPPSIPEEMGRAEEEEQTMPEAYSPEELKTPEVVPLQERMKTYPSPGEYIALSLNVAQKLIAGIKAGHNYRVVDPEVYNLGGINQIHGLVYDRQAGDMILVGKYNPERQPLTLDDFVVALRARFVHNKWPLVSIDPPDQTKKTEMQIVRFEGGIEDTQFGADLFDADYRLKRIGMGLLLPGIPGLKTHWDLFTEVHMEWLKGSFSGKYNINSGNINSRFWFYPVNPNVAVREDVVSIKGLKVGVFTEVLSAEINGKMIEDLSTFQDVAGDRFARVVSDNFEGLSKMHPSFLRLQGLNELVALTKAIEEMGKKPDLSFWLKDYEVRKVKTKREVKVLKRHEEYELPFKRGIQRGYWELSGGVELMAIALRLKAGDVTALKEAVLKTRPKSDALTWGFVVAEWLIPTAPGMLETENLAALFVHAVSLQQKKHYDDAIAMYGKIIELKPDWDWVYNNRGVAYDKKGQYDLAISDYNRALEINPQSADAYYNRGTTYADKGQYDLAISDFNQALEINPQYVEAYTHRGNVYTEKGQYDPAISDFNRALEINPQLADAYYSRGTTYADKGQYNLAISDYSRALEINPQDAVAYHDRAVAYFYTNEYDKAWKDVHQVRKLGHQVHPGFLEALQHASGRQK